MIHLLIVIGKVETYTFQVEHNLSLNPELVRISFLTDLNAK